MLWSLTPSNILWSKHYQSTWGKWSERNGKGGGWVWTSFGEEAWVGTIVELAEENSFCWVVRKLEIGRKPEEFGGKSEDQKAMESTKSGVSIPKWNGKQETFAWYAAKLHALAVYYKCGDAFEEAVMAKLVTRSQYDSIINKTMGARKQAADLYNANKQMCALIVLGQDSDHGLAMMNKTTLTNHPHGNAFQFLKLCAHKNRP